MSSKELFGIHMSALEFITKSKDIIGIHANSYALNCYESPGLPTDQTCDIQDGAPKNFLRDISGHQTCDIQEGAPEMVCETQIFR